jgi:hypothetical protein
MENFWDTCTTRTLDLPFATVRDRRVGTLSGGEQKRMALEPLLRGEDDVLLLDEPDNFLDVAGKRWLEGELSRSTKTILFVSHDRELLAATATRIVTIEGHGSWTHGGSFATYHDARQARLEKLTKDNALYDAERERLEELVKEMSRRAKISETFAPKLKAAQSRLRHFDESSSRRRWRPEDHRAPPWRPHGQKSADVRALGPARTHRSVRRRDLVRGRRPCSAQWRGQEPLPPAVGETNPVPTTASSPRRECQTLQPDARTSRATGAHALQILERHDVLIGPAMGMLRRYERTVREQTFDTLSGSAAFQILLLELEGDDVSDEPTDNLDLVSAEALETGLPSSRAPSSRSPRPLVPAQLRPLSCSTTAACSTSRPPPVCANPLLAKPP